MGPSESHDEPTAVDPLRRPPGASDLEARRAKAQVAAALFGEAPADADTPVATVGRYVIRERLGAGGMGVVYRAHDPELDREVAVKVLLPDAAQDDDARARMVREARALARLSHPNVIPVYDVGRHDDEIFVAMELVEGADLSRWLTERTSAGTGAWREIVDVFLQAARGLAAAHAQGLVHRDFKPANVLLGTDGRARVVDFGLARPVDPAATPLIDEAPTRTGAIIGTPMYMAPEQLEGRPATAASDQFALCVSLYGALYGARPFRGGTVASYVSHVLAGEVIEPEATGVPPAVYRALRRGLATDPDRRWPSLSALIEALEQARDGVPARGGSPRLWLAGAAAVLALGLGTWWTLSASATPRAEVVAGPALGSTGDDETRAMVGETVGVDADAVDGRDAGVGPHAGDEPRDEPRDGPDEGETTAEGVGATDDGARTGEAGESVADAGTPRTPVARVRDWCSFHEDRYTLIDRGPRRRRAFVKDGTCWSCRRETSRSRIARLSPSDCGSVQMCGPRPAEECA